MPSYTIYADANDFIVVCNGPDYSDARSGAGGLSTETGVSSHFVGQFADSIFYCQQYFPQFDTSAVSGTFVSGSFNLTISSRFANNKVFEVREHAWPTAGNTSAFVAGASLGGKALFGTFSSGTSNGLKTATCGLSDVARTTTYRLVIAAEEQRTGTPPGGYEGVAITAAESSGTTDDPYLSITTVTATNHPGAGVFSGTGTFSGAGSIVKNGSAAFSGTGSFAAIATFSLGGRASFTGIGTFAGSGRLAAQGSASFAGTGTFAGNGNVALSGAALFAGVGTFTAASALAMQGSCSFAATSRFIATPKLKILQRSLGRYPSYARSVRTSQVRWRGGVPTRN